MPITNIFTGVFSDLSGWLTVVPVFLLVLCLVLILTLLVQRTLTARREKRKNELRFRYQYLLYDALVESQSKNAPDNFVEVAIRLLQNENQKKNLDRQILTNILLNLRKSISGDQKQFLDLACALKLPEYLLQKLRQRKLSIQVQGIQEISALDISNPEIKNEVEALQASFDSHVPQEVVLAMMKLNISPDFSFLSELTVPLSEWMQIRLHHYLRTVERHHLPDFSRWLDSNNESVVLFSLRMIADLKQQVARESVLLLLTNTSPAIVLEAINTVVQLKLSEALPILINLVQEVNKDIQLASLQAIGELGNHQQVSNLHSLRNHPDYWVRQATSHAINQLQSEML